MQPIAGNSFVRLRGLRVVKRLGPRLGCPSQGQASLPRGLPVEGQGVGHMQELLGIAWLAEEVGDMREVGRIQGDLEVRVGGEEDGGRIGHVPGLAQELDAVHGVHPEVADDDVHAVVTQHLEAHIPAVREVDIEAVVLKEGGQACGYVDIVFDDKDRRHGQQIASRGLTVIGWPPDNEWTNDSALILGSQLLQQLAGPRLLNHEELRPVGPRLRHEA